MGRRQKVMRITIGIMMIHKMKTARMETTGDNTIMVKTFCIKSKLASLIAIILFHFFGGGGLASKRIRVTQKFPFQQQCRSY